MYGFVLIRYIKGFAEINENEKLQRPGLDEVSLFLRDAAGYIPVCDI